MIGLMRYGRLLAEANPELLLDQFQMDTIEDVFLNLCERDDSTQNNQTNTEQITIRNEPKKKVNLLKYDKKRRLNFYFDWCRVQTLFLDAFTFANSDFWVILLACLLPTIQISLFHLSVGKPPNSVSVAIASTENRSTYFSEIFINSFDPSIKMVNKEPFSRLFVAISVITKSCSTNLD